jgi:hypothetical protein
MRLLEAGHVHYTPALGITPLREAISSWYSGRYGVQVPTSRIAVTTGSSGALLLTMGVLLDPGDEVLMADPGYPCNRHFVRAIDGVPVGVNVGPQTAYQLTASWSSGVDAMQGCAGLLMASRRHDDLEADAARSAMSCARRSGILISGGSATDLPTVVPPHCGFAGRRRLRDQQFLQVFRHDRLPSRLAGGVHAFMVDVDKLARNLFISPPTSPWRAALAAFEPDTIADGRAAWCTANSAISCCCAQALGFEVQ